jgi:hypothetical protein
VLQQRDGHIGQFTSGYHSCALFAKWDKAGVIEIDKMTKGGPVVIFQRQVEGVLNQMQLKEKSRLERKLNMIQKQINQKIESYNSGNYNGTGDISSYSDDLISGYANTLQRLDDQVNVLHKMIINIK